MANFTILFWNVENFSDKKLDVGDVVQVVGALVDNYDVDLVLLAETEMDGQTGIVRAIHEKIVAQSSASWFAFASDSTGKARLPPEIIYKWPHEPKRKKELAYWPDPELAEIAYYKTDLERCYNDIPLMQTMAVKRPGPNGDLPYTRNDESFCRDALERAEVWPLRNVETYTGFFRYNPIASTRDVYVAGNGRIAIPRVGAADLISWKPDSTEIGYQDRGSGFNGRTPWVVNLRVVKVGAPSDVVGRFPLVCFHAPFGKSNEPRIAANVGLLSLTTQKGQNTYCELQEQEQCAVVADFNVPFDWDIDYRNPGNPRNISYRNYGPFYTKGFDLGHAVREKTSLRKLGPKNGNVLKGYTDPVEFRASAYDNILVRGVGGNLISSVSACAVDLIKDSHEQINYLVSKFPVPSGLTLFETYMKIRTLSDHLPVVGRLEVSAQLTSSGVG